jgi:hypothetical protein
MHKTCKSKTLKKKLDETLAIITHLLDTVKQAMRTVTNRSDITYDDNANPLAVLRDSNKISKYI